MKILILILISALLVLTGCSSILTAKDCKPSDLRTKNGEIVSNCRYILPWN